MPIIISPAYNNPGLGEITKNLGIALFGENDPTKLAQRDYYQASSAKARAEADKYGVEADRGRSALTQFNRLSEIQQALVRLPGEDDYHYLARTAPARGQQMMINPDSSTLDITTAGNRIEGAGMVQSDAADSRRRGALLLGMTPSVNDGVTAGEVVQSQQADYNKAGNVANIGAAASRYGADRSASASMYGHNLTYRASQDRLKAEHPFPGMDLAPDHTFIPAPGAPAPDMARAIHGPKSGGGQPLTVNPADAGMLDLAIARGYDGAVTEAQGKTPAHIHPKFWASVGPAARQAAELAAQEEFQRTHNPASAAAAGQRAIGQVAGTPWSAPGFFSAGGFPAAQQAAAPAAPAVPQQQQPAAGANPYTPDDLAKIAAQHHVTPDQVYYDPRDGSVRLRQPHQQQAPQQQQTAAPPPMPMPEPMTVNQVFAPNPTEAVTVSASRPDELPPTAQVFVPPPLPDLAHPIMPSADVPGFNIQSPELAASGFASPTAVMIARQSRDPAVVARVAAYDAAQNAGQRGPQAPPPPPAMTFSSPGKARQVANDQRANPADRRAAQAYLLQHPGGH